MSFISMTINTCATTHNYINFFSEKFATISMTEHQKIYR